MIKKIIKHFLKKNFDENLKFSALRNRILFRYGVFYVHFLRFFWRRMRKSILERKGKCNKCGVCCGFGSEHPCPNLDLQTKLCKDFELAKLMGCVLFPIHPLDQKKIGVENICGYYWEKPKQ